MVVFFFSFIITNEPGNIKSIFKAKSTEQISHFKLFASHSCSAEVKTHKSSELHLELCSSLPGGL